MHEIDLEAFEGYLRAIRSGWIHLELRDSYGVDDENEAMQAWRRGEPYELQGLEATGQFFSRLAAAGKVLRRLKVVSEPLSDYQRWGLDLSRHHVRAGEDIRVVNRKHVSSVLMPPSDFYVVDNARILFLHHDGSGGTATFSTTDDSAVVTACAESFQRAWEAALPLDDYLGSEQRG